jgi:hypothetical protein
MVAIAKVAHCTGRRQCRFVQHVQPYKQATEMTEYGKHGKP